MDLAVGDEDGSGELRCHEVKVAGGTSWRVVMMLVAAGKLVGTCQNWMTNLAESDGCCAKRATIVV